MGSLELSVFNCGIRINCFDARAEVLIQSGYSWFIKAIQTPLLSYHISRDGVSEPLLIRRESAGGGLDEVTRTDSDFLYLFDKDLTIETQKLRSDLFFVHAAVVELDGIAIALVGPSGSGKSTTTWGLLHHGFNYLSDELAPVDFAIRVCPFPRALCLKGTPPNGYSFPNHIVYTSPTSHIPSEYVPTVSSDTPVPLTILIFLQYSAVSSEPLLKPLPKAAAVARLFASSLNPLAHSSSGLDAVVQIVSNTCCFELVSSDLDRTCELIKETCGTIQKHGSNSSKNLSTL
jgi:hypothetical protein